MVLRPEFDDPIELWPQPDLSVLHNRRDPPPLPLEVFGPAWGAWIEQAADAAACPPDYVATPLLSATSTLIGNARWPHARAWSEPPHLWTCSVGESGTGKSPGGDCLMRDVLPEIERLMIADFPDRLQEWKAANELAKAAEEQWKSDVRDARKAKKAPPMPPQLASGPEPQAPRLRQHDVTVEKVAILLAGAAPKGLLIWRDELIGWIEGMSSYNSAARSFWLEAYGGRFYRVERQKHPEPIDVPHNAVAVYGSTQPDKIVQLMGEADDGLLSRILWAWPRPVPFRLGRSTPNANWAINALDRLRLLDLQPGDPPRPIKVPLVDDAITLIEEFGQEMQERQVATGGLFRSALGKARGHALRLSLVIEYLLWCGSDGMAAPPRQISKLAFGAAAHLISKYFCPMAQRVYGDAAIPEADRLTSIVARWIVSSGIASSPRPIINARTLRREAGLPGLREAEKVSMALGGLVEADWLRSAPSRSGETGGRMRSDYLVNPRLKSIKDAP